MNPRIMLQENEKIAAFNFLSILISFPYDIFSNVQIDRVTCLAL